MTTRQTIPPFPRGPRQATPQPAAPRPYRFTDWASI